MRLRIVRRTTAVVFLALLAINAGFWLVLGQRADHDIGVALDSRSHSALALVVVDAGHLGVEETPGDEAIESSFWLFAPDGAAVVQPASAPELSTAVHALARHGSGNITSGDLRLRATPAVIAGRTVGTVVVGVSLAEFISSQHTSLAAALVLDVLILAGTVLLTSRTVTTALRPVEDMTSAAREWSHHSLERRLPTGSDEDEFTHLAVTLNSLLSRIGGLLRHEQTVTAEIAHEIKTPLTRMVSSADVALTFGTASAQETALREVMAEAHGLAKAIDDLLETSHSRGPGVGRCDVTVVARTQIEASQLRTSDVKVSLHAPALPMWAACDEAVAARALSPLIANAIKHASTSVALHIIATRDHVDVNIFDDGGGFNAREVENVFQAGFRGDTRRGPGHGLGLTLARRIARSAAGEVTAHPGPGGRVHLQLPAA